MKNKILSIVLICILSIAALVGCGGGSGGLSAKEIVTQASTAMVDVKNYKAAIIMNLDMNAQSMDITADINGDMDIFLDPLKTKMIMNMDSPLLGSAAFETYVMQEGDNLVSYVNSNGTWQKTTQPFSEELMAQYTQTNYSNIFSDSLKQADILGEESINDVECWKIHVIIDASSVKDLLKNMQGADSLTSIIPTDAFQNMSDMSADIWVAKDNFYQMRVDMDMTESLASVMENFGITLNALQMSMTLSDFGNATDFTLPDAAKNAPEL